MIKLFATGFALFALSMTAAETYRVTLPQSSVLEGTGLGAGAYRLDLQDGKAVMVHGKQRVEVPVRIDSGDQKFASTNVVYTLENGKPTIREIQLRGTKTKLLFGSEVRTGGGN